MLSKGILERTPSSEGVALRELVKLLLKLPGSADIRAHFQTSRYGISCVRLDVDRTS